MGSRRRVRDMSRSFVHLHLHTEYSMLDGAARVQDVVARAAADGQPAVGITDHGNMYGVLDFYRAARDAGHQADPRHGGVLRHHEPVRSAAPRRARHLPPHAARRATEGYRNLIKVVVARVPRRLLLQAARRLRAARAAREGSRRHSGCLGGAVCQRLLADDYAGARDSSTASRRSSGATTSSSSCRTTACPSSTASTRSCMRIARDLRAPLLATNDSHYTHRDDAESHAALLCVQTGSTLDDPKRFKFDADEFYLKTAAEMRSLFPDYEEACDNTLLDRGARRRRDRVRQRGAAVVRDSAGPRRGLVPPRAHLRGREGTVRGHAAATWSSGSSTSSASSRRWGSRPTSSWCGTSCATRATRGIRVGPGRGSAAGSCVAYCLGIVDIDPIRYDLLFERFLNPGRKQMPDIDMDFDSRYRGEMIKYARERYGEDHVAQIVTFSTIKARAAVRDAARVLGYPYVVGDKIAKLMPPLDHGPRHAAARVPRSRSRATTTATRWRPSSASSTAPIPTRSASSTSPRGLEGLRRQDGIHAAAVVITREPLTEYLPIQRKPEPGGNLADAPIVTQYEMHGVEDLGLLKMDFLGLRNLDVIEITRDLVEREHAASAPTSTTSPSTTPRRSSCSAGATPWACSSSKAGRCARCCARSRPTQFEDVAALVALYRPGPMAQNWHNEYADRKNGRKPVNYPHPDLEEVLEPTYGLMIYQEQLMRVAQRLAGLLARRGRQPPQGHGQEDPRPDREGAVEVRRRLRRAGPRPRVRRADLRHHRAVRRLLVQQVALGRLRLPRVPDRVPEGEPPGRVPRRAAHQREVQQGPDGGLPQRVPPARASRCSSPTSTSRSPTSRCGAASDDDGEERRTRSASACPRCATSARGWSALIVAAPRRGRAVHRLLRLLRAGRPAVLNKRTIESLIKAGGFDSLGHPRQGLLHVFEPIVDTGDRRRRKRGRGHEPVLGGRGEPTSTAVRRPAAPRSPTSSSRSRSGSRSRRRCSGSTCRIIR